MTVLSKIPKIDDGEVDGLLLSGILTTDDLLRLGKKAKARELIVTRSGISETRILRLVHMVDLARIGGIGWEYAEALDRVGVHSLAALSVEDPARLRTKLERLRERQENVRRLPTLDKISDWIRQARCLSSSIEE